MYTALYSLVVVGKSAARKKNNKLLEAKNVNIDSKRFSRKQNVSSVNVFLFETLRITPRRHICSTQVVILFCHLPAIFFVSIVALCNKHATSSRDVKSKI